MSVLPKRCEFCAYYDGHVYDGNLRDSGECRLNAPIKEPSNPWGEWPLVYQGDWCGHYKEGL